jgi:hypothetical protein
MTIALGNTHAIYFRARSVAQMNGQMHDRFHDLGEGNLVQGDERMRQERILVAQRMLGPRRVDASCLAIVVV